MSESDTMEINIRHLVIAFLIIFGGCTSSTPSCQFTEIKRGDISFFIEPYSTTNIINYENKRGLLNSSQIESRKKELADKLHFKVRVVNKSEFTDKQKAFFKNKMKEALTVTQNNLTLDEILFIDESAFSIGNLTQFLYAFSQSDGSGSEDIKVTIAAGELGIDSDSVFFQMNCLQ